MGLCLSTRLLGDGAKELSHLPALQQGSNLRQAEWTLCGISNTCPSQTLPTSLLRLCITSLSYSKAAWMRTRVLKVRGKACGTTRSKGNLLLIRGEVLLESVRGNCEALSNAGWGCCGFTACVCMLLSCPWVSAGSPSHLAEQLCSISATADGPASAFKAARHLEKWLTGKWRKSHILSKVTEHRGFPRPCCEILPFCIPKVKRSLLWSICNDSAEIEKMQRDLFSVIILLLSVHSRWSITSRIMVAAQEVWRRKELCVCACAPWEAPLLDVLGLWRTQPLHEHLCQYLLQLRVDIYSTIIPGTPCFRSSQK